MSLFISVRVPYGHIYRRNVDSHLEETGDYHHFQDRNGIDHLVKTREDAADILYNMYNKLFIQKKGEEANFNDYLRTSKEHATENTSLYLYIPAK